MDFVFEQFLKNMVFQFKQFAVAQDRCVMKIGTDGVLLGAWADTNGAKTALDIGTGSGVIAIMLGQKNDDLAVHAVEIDENAAQQCQENMKAAPWATRLTTHHMAIQDFVENTDNHYDLIVSNPPFFSGGTFSSDENRNNVRHTIKLPHGDLLNAAKQLLSQNGKFCVILPHIEGLRFVELAENYHLYCTKITEVKGLAEKPVERLLLQFELEKKSLTTTELTIQHQKRNDWTDDYIALTKDFYLHL